NAMVKRAQHQPEVVIAHRELDKDPWLLNVENGTLDLRTGTLQDHKREDFITKMVPISYNPEAQCPKWEAFLLDIMGDNEGMVAFLQRVIGYTLTGRTTEQCFFILYGSGGNGKSKVRAVMEALLGEHATTAAFSTFLESRHGTVRNDLAKLAGARLVVASESNAGGHLAESDVKTLTGGDRVTARFLYQEHFEFTPQFKLFLITNHKPEIKSQDHGMWRRIHLIPFMKTIAEEDEDKYFFEHVLQPE